MEASQQGGRSASASVAERQALRQAKRIVIKVGTNVVTRANGEIAIGPIHGIIEDIVALRRQGKQPILVSSGAIGLGMHRLGLGEPPALLARRQACAAAGQGQLMALYDTGFGRLGVVTAQILLTEDDFTNRLRYLNLRNAVQELLELGVVPIVNENDTVSTVEIEDAAEQASVPFGDNDMLSALVMSEIDGDALVLLSDVDGLQDRAPDGQSTTNRIPVVREFGPDIERLAAGTSRGGRSRGGIVTKLKAARVATRCGGHAVIAHGQQPGVLGQIFAGEDVGTVFLPQQRLSGKRRWIGYATAPVGRLTVNAGARTALVQRKASLLWAGLEAVQGEFIKGDVVALVGPDGVEFARGIVNYSTDVARQLVGCHSKELSGLVKQRGYDALVTRDNITILHWHEPVEPEAD